MDSAPPRHQAAPSGDRPAESPARTDDARDHPAPPEPMARDNTGRAPEDSQPPLKAAAKAARRDTIKRLALATGKRLSTLAIALVALLVSLLTLQHYVNS